MPLGQFDPNAPARPDPSQMQARTQQAQARMQQARAGAKGPPLAGRGLGDVMASPAAAQMRTAQAQRVGQTPAYAKGAPPTGLSKLAVPMSGGAFQMRGPGPAPGGFPVTKAPTAVGRAAPFAGPRAAGIEQLMQRGAASRGTR